MKLNTILGFLIFLFIHNADAESAGGSQEEPPPIGNFALPTSQQPGPLMTFGQNIIDKNQTQLYLVGNDFAGADQHAVNVTPSILYAITDNFSIFFALPIAASYKVNQTHSSGLADSTVQLEYAFYTKKTYQYIDQATVVTNASIPTGSSTRQPPTGIGAPSVFIGATFLRTYTDWLAFISPGATLTTASDNNTQFGNQYFYQAGIGRNIMSIHSKLIFNWLIEANGEYTEKNKIDGITDPNSGGNVVYVTPSLWLSTKQLILQMGAGLAVTQHLFGNQNRNSYLLTLSLGWTL